jgi:hypothetical protein
MSNLEFRFRKALSVFRSRDSIEAVPNPPSLKIAQRFNAGLRWPKNSKSLQGQKNRLCWMPLLSSPRDWIAP